MNSGNFRIAFLAAAFAAVFTINCGPPEETPDHNNPDTGGYDTGDTSEDSPEETTGDTPDDDSGVDTNDTNPPDTEVTEADSDTDETTSDPCWDCWWIEEVPLWTCRERRWELTPSPREGQCWLTVYDINFEEGWDAPPTDFSHNKDGRTVQIRTPETWTCVPTSGI